MFQECVEGVSSVFQGCFECPGCLKAVLMVFHECPIGVSSMFQECFMDFYIGLTKEVQVCFNSFSTFFHECVKYCPYCQILCNIVRYSPDSPAYQGCSLVVVRVIQWYLSDVLRVFQGCLKGISCLYQ